MSYYRIEKDVEIKECDLIPGEFYRFDGMPDDCFLQFVGFRVSGNPTFVPVPGINWHYYSKDSNGLIGFSKSNNKLYYRVVFNDTLIQF